MKCEKKRLLVFASTFPRWKDDTNPPFVYELSKRLTGKFEVHVLAPHYPGAKTFEVMDSMQVYRFRYFIPRYEKLTGSGGIVPTLKRNKFFYLQVPFFIAAEFFALIRLIRKIKPDIIHAHWAIPQGIISYACSRIYRIPYIATVHGGDIYPFNLNFVRYLRRLTINNSFCTTVNSSPTLQEVEKIPYIEKGKLKILPMGVELSTFRKKREAGLRKKLGNGKILLFVGRLVEKKGVQYLIKATKIVSEKFPDIKLLIIGQGEYEKELRRLCNEIRAEEKVIFLGAIPNKKIARYYNAADIFVLPSMSSKFQGYEGLGVVLIEAMVCGTSVIGSNVGGIPDIIINKRTGLLFEPDDEKDLAEKISYLLSNPKIKERIARNGREYSNKFDWNKIAKEFSKLLEEAANEK